MLPSDRGASSVVKGREAKSQLVSIAVLVGVILLGVLIGRGGTPAIRTSAVLHPAVHEGEHAVVLIGVSVAAVSPGDVVSVAVSGQSAPATNFFFFLIFFYFKYLHSSPVSIAGTALVGNTAINLANKKMEQFKQS